MNCKLTLICPSYERHHYLRRSFSFWGHRDDVYVIYADGSHSPLESPAMSAPNLRYLHHPVSIQERLLALCDQVSTPYVCLLGDDEFYIPSAMQSCVDFLECHSDYVACMGRAIGFSRLRGNIALSPQYPRLRNRDLSDSVALNRLESHFSSYVPAHCYAITKTDVFQAAMEAALSIELDILSIFELVEESIIAAAGKSIVLPVLYWLRSFEAPPIRNTGDLGLDTSKLFHDWWSSNEAEIEKRYLCRYLSKAASGNASESDFEIAFDCYYENTYGQVNSFSSRLKRSLPSPLKSTLGMLRVRGQMFSNYLINPTATSNAAVQDLRDQGVVIDEDGLAECLASIRQSWRL